MNLLERTLGENALWVWLLALGVFAMTFLGLKLTAWGIRRQLTARYERTKSELVRLMADLARRTHLLFLLAVALYAGSLAVELPAAASQAIGTLAVLAFLIQAASWGGRIITYWVNRAVKRKLEEEGDAATATTLNAVAFLAKIALWTLALLLALENMGIDITALVTGLGIAGIAVALALQNILGDLFASISIVVDKPFLVGDFIIVGDLLGTVERIGLKTTRLRSLTGEQIIFSNAELLKSRIRNFKRMRERRIVFSFGVVYETPWEKLAAIPGMVREIVESQPNTRFDRAHFKEYGDFALRFEVVYYVLVPDYNVYMDIQQAINLELYRRFREEDIEFAYPTQTVYVRPAAPSVAGEGGEGAHGR
ncbi:mechanosensitive ion channel family protein [Candidatus Bipolaricaulota bacterium]|nr:mechanosensitive ion channel family protein [Candidatus Bipolaricaulota bacterium]